VAKTGDSARLDVDVDRHVVAVASSRLHLHSYDATAVTYELIFNSIGNNSNHIRFIKMLMKTMLETTTA
jgi:hypothetical protein